MPKSGLGNMAHLLNIHRAQEGISLNNVEYEFWFCPDDIKHCVSGRKKKYVLDWPISAQHVSGENRYHSVKRGGFGT